MAVKLPNGATVFIATGLSDGKAVTVATNAAEAVLTASAHGLKNGEFVVLQSGWGGLNGRVVKVTRVTDDTFKLDGVDTTNTDRFPAGSGIGSFKKVTGWQQITQITEFTTSGGEQQFTEFGFLEEDFDRQLPTTRSAGSLSITIADDPELAGYKAAAKASDTAAEMPLRINLKNGSVIVYNGYPSVAKTPTLTRNEIMTLNISYALSGEPSRYN